MISIFINSLTSGGAEKVVLTLTEKFREAGEDIDLIFIEKEQFYDIPKGVKTTYLTNFKSLEKSLLSIPYLFISAFKLKKHINKNKISVVQSHLVRASFINIIARMLGAKHYAQIVVHSRLNPNSRLVWYGQLKDWIYKQVFLRADSVISICEIMKNELTEKFSLQKYTRLEVIFNPHNLEEIKEKAASPVDDFHFEPDKKYLVTAGRLVKRKRIQDLISAFKNIHESQPKVELIIIGDGKFKPELEKLAETLNLVKGIHFLGYKTNPYNYIAKSQLFVLPSSMEGLPNVIIEAMACGTPVISTDCISGPREILNPNSDLKFILQEDIELGEFGILYPTRNVELLEKGINRLLSDDTLWQNYKSKGLQRVKDFEASHIAEKYLRLLKTPVAR